MPEAAPASCATRSSRLQKKKQQQEEEQASGSDEDLEDAEEDGAHSSSGEDEDEERGSGKQAGKKAVKKGSRQKTAGKSKRASRKGSDGGDVVQIESSSEGSEGSESESAESEAESEGAGEEGEEAAAGGGGKRSSEVLRRLPTKVHRILDCRESGAKEYEFYCKFEGGWQGVCEGVCAHGGSSTCGCARSESAAVSGQGGGCVLWQHAALCCSCTTSATCCWGSFTMHLPSCLQHQHLAQGTSTGTVHRPPDLPLTCPRPRPAGKSYRQAAWVAHAAVERKQPALLKSFLRRKLSGEVDQEWGEGAVHGAEPEWLKVGG